MSLRADLARILDFVAGMQAIDTRGVEPLGHPLDAVQRLRADAVTESNQRESLQAPATVVENGVYLVPQVIE